MPKPQKNTNKMREIPEEEAFEMKFQAEMQVGFEESRAQAELEKRTRSARTAARAEARASSGAAGATPMPSALGSSSASAWTPTLAGSSGQRPVFKAPPPEMSGPPPASGAASSRLTDMGPPPVPSKPAPSSRAPTSSTLGATNAASYPAAALVLGGVFTAESVAPSTASSCAVRRLSGEGQCNLLAPCRQKDRVISKMSRRPFEFLTGEDEPDTSVICGEDGPGFYPRLMRGPQWSMELYDLNLELNPYDFMHHQSGSTVACVRKLLLGHCDVLRFGLGMASGEYVPWA